MKISSPAFDSGGEIPVDYTCDGRNISPPFEISDVPKGAKSLVLIIDDPDAPGGPYIHWLIYNFSPFTTKIEEGNLPGLAAMGKNSADSTVYVGPCPPSGTHHYNIKLYALDRSLELQYPTAEEVLNALKGSILAEASMVGLYTRG